VDFSANEAPLARGDADTGAPAVAGAKIAPNAVRTKIAGLDVIAYPTGAEVS